MHLSQNKLLNPSKTLNFENEPSSRQYLLTELISAIFNWLEESNSSYFCYGEVRLRHALECYFYFAGVNNVDALLPLLKIGEEWRLKQLSDTQLTNFYDECISDLTESIYVNKLKFLIKKHLLLFRLLIKPTINLSSKTKTQDATQQSQVAFFAINARIAYFFSEILDSIGKENCAFVTLKNRDVSVAAKDMPAKVLEDTYHLFNYKYLNMSVMHPLFYFYLLAIQGYLLALGTLQRQKISVVVFAEGTSMQDELVSLAAKSLNIPTLRIQSGRAGVIHSGYRNMSFDRILVWGQGFIDRLKPYSNFPNFQITGNPDIQPVNDSNIHYSIFKDVKKKPVISVFTQPLNIDLTDSDYVFLVNLVSDIITSIQEVNVIVRKHPVDKRQDFENLSLRFPNHLKVTQSRDYKLNSLYAISDLALGFYSTTLSEASAYGVVALLLQLKPAHSVFPYPEKHNVAISVNNSQQALEVVNKILTDRDYKKKFTENLDDFADYYFGPRDGKALNRIITNIQTIV